MTTRAARPWWLPFRAVIGGLALSFAVGLVYAEIASGMGDWNQGFVWERALMLRIHQPVPPILDRVFYLTPWLGTNLTLIPLIVTLGWWLWRPLRRPDLAVQLFTVQVGSYLLNPSLKAMFDRERPHLFEQRGWFAWSSYPSGHAIASVSVLVTIAIVVYRAKGWKWPFFVLVPTMLASVYSRIYLGVHWPTDVFAGALVGAVWLSVTMYAFRDRRTPSGDESGQSRSVDIAAADDRRNPFTVT